MNWMKVNEHAVALGKKGGKAGRGAVKARTSEQASAAAQTRWVKFYVAKNGEYYVGDPDCIWSSDVAKAWAMGRRSADNLAEQSGGKVVPAPSANAFSGSRHPSNITKL